MSILVVGSVGLDTLETPSGTRADVLGGSASHIALSASRFGAAVRLVGVVGDDFPGEYTSLFEAGGIDLSGLVTKHGSTFRWHGRYEDFGVAQTVSTQLNVFEHFDPVVPEEWHTTPFVVLGNIDPKLQGRVLDTMKDPRLTVLDTMNFWIQGCPEDVMAMISRVDVVLVNEQEARDLTGCRSLASAGKRILQQGCQVVVIKRGEHGATMMTVDGDLFFCPVYPSDAVIDTTGAGDSFAGGFVGHLCRAGTIGPDEFRQAVVYGCIMGSFNVEGFGVEVVKDVSPEAMNERYHAMKKSVAF